MPFATGRSARWGRLRERTSAEKLAVVCSQGKRKGSGLLLSSKDRSAGRENRDRCALNSWACCYPQSQRWHLAGQRNLRPTVTTVTYRLCLQVSSCKFTFKSGFFFFFLWCLMSAIRRDTLVLMHAFSAPLYTQLWSASSWSLVLNKCTEHRKCESFNHSHSLSSMNGDCSHWLEIKWHIARYGWLHGLDLHANTWTHAKCIGSWFHYISRKKKKSDLKSEYRIFLSWLNISAALFAQQQTHGAVPQAESNLGIMILGMFAHFAHSALVTALRSPLLQLFWR